MTNIKRFFNLVAYNVHFVWLLSDMWRLLRLKGVAFNRISRVSPESPAKGLTESFYSSYLLVLTNSALIKMKYEIISVVAIMMMVITMKMIIVVASIVLPASITN